MTAPAAGFRRLLDVFERLGIGYMVAGSAASSTHGLIRATRDIDLVVDLKREHIGSLVAELRGGFYIDAEMIEEALRLEGSFNLIELETSFKFDVFALTLDPYQQAQFGRRVLATSTQFGPEPLEFRVATAEDTVLSKLAWFRRGGEVSETQWKDVRGVLEVQRGRLDLDYMRRWGRYLKLDELLERALTAAGAG